MTFDNVKMNEFNINCNIIPVVDRDNQINKNSNPRANMTAKKYQKNVIWRRNKVKELLFKGYDQQEIVSILHVSQPTISRDIAFLHNQRENEINNYGKLLFENHFDIVNGSTELLKQAWKILDNPKTDNKTRLKTMDFIKDIYDKRIELFQGLPYMVKIREKMKEVNKKEKYFKDNKIKLNYAKPMTAEEFNKSYKKNILKERKREALF
ncbi:MAG: hypothetical protein R2685_15640 [Candidatus Nitrosocosmicus sp.]|nr:hypothetical protein [Candidatus Nitrosocosmicus sp.]